ncbi:MAG: F0F1 ATP synthase subunit A [Clostridiales bacterium]|nr:F0F1 ATP synthase subunit A [Clostridiales bacterium]MBP3811476.1 F0F1 ATP synthase subunit A [Clostridiales bacterium]MBR3532556.1 F0F1 ATP synthase subunit A [Clostridiales bacterium]
MTVLLLILSIIPLIAGILIKVLYVPASEGIDISGAHIFFTIDLPLGGLPITESQVNSWLVILSLFFFCLFLTHGLKTKNMSRRQIIAEWIVNTVDNLVKTNMGEFFMGFGPFIAAMLGLSACSSLLTLIGLFPPTSDINVTGGWALLTFILITYYKFKAGPLIYIKSFGDPVPFLAPLNIISEVATPISMAFRHYGNVLSGSIISILIANLLTNVSKMIFGFLPGYLGGFPYLRVGLPAILSIYFDLFSGALQAFIFAMLTMLYVSGGFPEDEYFKRKRIKEAKKKQQVIENTNGGV